MKPRVVFFGNERLATGLPEVKPLALQQLIDSGYETTAVVSRGSEAIKELSERHSIPYFSPQNGEELKDVLSDIEADLGVLVAFGMIVPDEIISKFKYGILNIHPSLLPLYRGSTPIEQAILDGVQKTGVSIMQLVAQMDAGPVCRQQEVELSATTNKLELAAKLHQIGAEIILDVIANIEHERPKPQDSTAATYCSRITKADGEIDWQKPAEQIDRKIRAFLGWPGSRTTIEGRDVIITAAEVYPGAAPEKNTLVMPCGQGTFLEILSLKPAGKREMSAQEFLRGLR